LATARSDSGGMERKKIGLTDRAHMSVREEREGPIAGMHKFEEKAPFGECGKAPRANWAEWGRWRPGETGPRSEAGLDSEEDLKRKLVFKFHLNLDFGKSWRKFTRRFRRNLDMGIFLKFF
jgi:hypothetical protein